MIDFFVKLLLTIYIYGSRERNSRPNGKIIILCELKLKFDISN